ncbi:hypothetical protein HYDPIDRAFT_92730, partial [Hydnomerulius pinastri MD-312]
DNHGKGITVRSTEAVASVLEDEHGVGGLGAGEEDNLVSCVRLHELEASDVERLVSESRSQCALDVVKVDEQAVNLDVAGAAATDSDGTVSLHAADVVSVEEHVFTGPWAEHVLAGLSVVEVVSCALVGDEANDASSALLTLGDDRERLVKKDKVGAALCGPEGDGGRDGVSWADEHLGDASETDFRALQQ